MRGLKESEMKELMWNGLQLFDVCLKLRELSSTGFENRPSYLNVLWLFCFRE